MQSLKAHVDAHRAAGREVQRAPEDDLVDALKAVVGAAWATGDPAIRITYAGDPCPLKPARMPRAVALPGSADEVAAVLRLARDRGVPTVVRGNGGSVFGMVFTEGIVLDMNRMRGIDIDEANWTAAVGPGVTVFEIQQEAHRRGFRVNAAEPAATVCGNILCTGLFSPWSASYGLAADNVVDMEFVDGEGNRFRLGDPGAPNLSAYAHAVRDLPGVCTRAVVRLHPRTADEEGLLVPFDAFDDAVHFARELGVRRIGLAVAVLGTHYLASFLAPTLDLARRLKAELPRVLGLRYAVLVVADAHGRQAVRRMAGSVIDSDLMRTIQLGLPRLLDAEWIDLVRRIEGRKRPYGILSHPDMTPFLEVLLQPSAETLAAAVDEDLREAYAELYRRPELSDVAWLTAFRIVSVRMARHKHVLAFLAYVPLDRDDILAHMLETFRRVGDARAVDHDYGFLTPLDFGKRAILEYDYYADHTDAEDRRRAAAVMGDLAPWLDELALAAKGVTWIKTFFSQGCARKESILYHGLQGRAAGGAEEKREAAPLRPGIGQKPV
jgi:hypothetical protein